MVEVSEGLRLGEAGLPHYKGGQEKGEPVEMVEAFHPVGQQGGQFYLAANDNQLFQQNPDLLGEIRSSPPWQLFQQIEHLSILFLRYWPGSVPCR